MTSMLGQALLGLLARGPGTGYQLTRLMRRPVGYFWTANHSQIYPELARLEEAGLVRHKVIDGAGPRDTKRYAITAAGRDELAEWVVSEPLPQPVRDLETLKLWSIWTAEPDDALALIGSLRATHAERLAAYEREQAEVEADPRCRRPDHPLFASRLTLAGGIGTQRAALDWCDWMLTQFGAAGDQPS